MPCLTPSASPTFLFCVAPGFLTWSGKHCFLRVSVGAQKSLHLRVYNDLNQWFCSWLFLGISSEMGAVLYAGEDLSLLHCIIQEQLLTESGKGKWSLQPSWRLYNVACFGNVIQSSRTEPLWHLKLGVVWVTFTWLCCQKRNSVSLKWNAVERKEPDRESLHLESKCGLQGWLHTSFETLGWWHRFRILLHNAFQLMGHFVTPIWSLHGNSVGVAHDLFLKTQKRRPRLVNQPIHWCTVYNTLRHCDFKSWALDSGYNSSWWQTHVTGCCRNTPVKCRDTVSGLSSLYFGNRGKCGSLNLGLANKFQVWDLLFLIDFIFYSTFRFTYKQSRKHRVPVHSPLPASLPPSFPCY